MERAEAALAASQDSVTGTLRIAAFQSAALTAVPQALVALEQLHPLLRIEVTERESEAALPALVAGDYDVVLGEEYPGRPQPRPKGTERQNLWTDELRLVVPASWSGRTLADLTGRPFVMEPIGTTAREWSTAVCRQAGFEPDVQHTSTDLQIHLRFVESGLTAALLPDLAGTLTRTGVTAHRLTGRPARQTFTAVRSGASRHPAIQALIAALRDTRTTA